MNLLKKAKSNKQNLISIVVTNWNGEDYLEKCIKSLVTQNYDKKEIVLVDNASIDNSVNLVMKKFPMVRIIKNKQNVGFPAGMNIGIKASKGNYILLMNNDTWIKKDFLRKLMKFYDENKYEVIAPLERRYKHEKFNKYNTTIDPLGSPAYYLPIYRKDKLFYLCGVCLFFKKKLYLETKGMDPDFFLYFEDADWFWRLSLFGKQFSYVDDIFIYHASAASAKTDEVIKLRTFKLRNRNIPQMLIKNYSAFALCFIMPLYFIQNLFEMIFFILILKPRIALTYTDGWLFNLKILKRTLKKREWIQKRRVVGDSEIVKKMYIGSGKLLHLIEFIRLGYSYGKK